MSFDLNSFDKSPKTMTHPLRSEDGSQRLGDLACFDDSKGFHCLFENERLTRGLVYCRFVDQLGLEEVVEQLEYGVNKRAVNVDE